jgi:chromosome segregation ATPase
MATESADEPELSVSLPPPLEEWVDEHAASLDVDREELLVQVVSAYRAAADLDADAAGGGSAPDLETLREEVRAEVETQLADHDVDARAVDDRVDTLESEIEEDLKSVRNRVLQLRDALRSRADADHTHEEFDRLADRLDDVAADATELSDDVSTQEADLDDVGAKLDTLARVVLELRDRMVDRGDDRTRQLDRLRRTANRQDVTDASCDSCGESISVPLLTDPACPHCDAELRDITTAGLIFTRGTLVGPEMSSGGDGDDDE